MEKSDVLKRFFEEQHRKLKQKAYTTLQCTCGSCESHSEYGEWVKHHAEAKTTDEHHPPKETKWHPHD